MKLASISSTPNSPVRRRFLEFLLIVAAIHIVAIALYYTLHVQRWTSQHQRSFAWVWMAATIAVIFMGLQRIKRARRGR